MDNSTGRRKRGWSPEVNRVAKLFCSDTNPTLRLKAARFLKTEGLDVLKTLFFTESVPEEVRAEAWVAYAHLKSLPTMDKSDEDHAAEAMIRRLSGRPGKSQDNVTTSPAKQELESMLTQYLSSKGRRSEEVLVAIFETTARLRLRIDYKLLAPAHSHSSPKVRASFALAAHLQESDRIETDLIKLLADTEVSVAVQAAMMLGKVGTTRAVEPLMKHTKSMLLGGELKFAALEAIQSIQSRVGITAHGGLSLINEEGGQLTLCPKTTP